MQQTGETLEARVRAGSKQLTARDTALTRKQARINALLQEGRSLDVAGRREVGKLRAEISRLERAGASLLQEGSTLQARVKAGAKQLGERDQRLAAMQQEGDVLQARVAAGTKQLTARDQRLAQMQQTGETMEARIKAGTKQLGARDQRITDLRREGEDLAREGNRRIQLLEKKIDDGNVSRAEAQSEIDELTRKLAEAARAPAAPEQKDKLKGLREDIAALRRSVKDMPRGGAPAAAAPIVVQGGAGGGGASSSAGGSSAASGGGGAAPRAAAPDFSKVVEAVKAMAESSKKKTGGGTKGITRARRTYTDKRKTKIAELRALKSKRIREFATRTKKLPAAERDKQRRAYKKRVEAQFKEMQTRFPTARGLKSVGVIRELIRKIDAFKAAK